MRDKTEKKDWISEEKGVIHENANILVLGRFPIKETIIKMGQEKNTKVFSQITLDCKQRKKSNKDASQQCSLMMS